MQGIVAHPLFHSNEWVLTSQQLAELYGTDTNNIRQNFFQNKERYVAGKHYFFLEGEELKRFKDSVGKSNVVEKQARMLYLWTKKGALHHVKSLGTDKAWKMYERLVDEYFELKQHAEQEQLRIYPWTAEAEQLRQLNMKAIQPGYWSSSAFVLQRLIYVDLSGIAPNERAKIDISFGSYFARWLKGDRSGQLKNCPLIPAYRFDEAYILKIGHIVDSRTKREFPVYHYANLYSGDRDNFWDLWYVPMLLPSYLGGVLPDGIPRVKRTLQR